MVAVLNECTKYSKRSQYLLFLGRYGGLAAMVSEAWLSNYDDGLRTCMKCVTWLHVFHIRDQDVITPQTPVLDFS